MLFQRKRDVNFAKDKVIAMCGVQLNDRERAMDMKLMLILDESIHKLAMASSVLWYGHVLRT